MHHDLRRFDTGDDAARAAAAFLLDAVETSTGRCTVAVSGGRTPTTMFDLLATSPLEWDRVTFLQVDERVAPDGDDKRNLTHLRASLAGVPAAIEPMDVTAQDLEASAARYAAGLPAILDVVHLGLGPDGHTASLVPGDAVLEVTDRLVALTQPYQGTRRMTLTYPALARADRVLWLVAGADKRDALRRLLDGDTTIPAGRVEASSSTVFADAAATG